MKILAITDLYPPYHLGGYGLRTQEILNRLRARGHSVRIATSTRPDAERPSREEDRDVLRRLSREGNGAGFAGRLINEVKDIRFIERTVDSYSPDIIYLFNVINLTKTLYPFFADRGTPIVFDEGAYGVSWSYNHHGSWFYLIEHKTRSKTRALIKSVLITACGKASGGALKREWSWPANMRGYFNSEWGRQNARAKGLPVEGTVVMAPGVDTALFGFASRDGVGRPLSVVCPGRIEPRKGQSDAVRVLALVLEKGIDARLTLVGHFRDPSYLYALEKDIRDLRVTNLVRIMPMVPHRQLPPVYQQSDICFFPSYHRSGLSRVPLEAMASGCVIISYGNEGSAETIRASETGFLTTEGDIEAVARLMEMLAGDPIAYRRVVRNARDAVSSRHSMDAYVDKIEAFLSEAVSA